MTALQSSFHSSQPLTIRSCLTSTTFAGSTDYSCRFTSLLLTPLLSHSGPVAGDTEFSPGQSNHAGGFRRIGHLSTESPCTGQVSHPVKAERSKGLVIQELSGSGMQRDSRTVSQPFASPKRTRLPLRLVQSSRPAPSQARASSKVARTSWAQ